MHQTTQKYFRIALLFAFILMAYESLTKGWGSLMLFPLLLPLLIYFVIIGNIVTKRAKEGRLANHSRLLAWTMLATVVAFYILVPGFGDTQEVLLFGFYVTNYDTLLATTSAQLAGVAFWIAATSIVALIVSLVISRKNR